MKKILIILLTLILFGCSNKKVEINDNKQEEYIDEMSEVIEEKEEVVDLTFMSSTGIYSEVYNMLNNPQDYVNKKIILKGLFTTGQDMNNELIFGCIIPDATACCAQGIQFVLDGDYKYPEDYPVLGAEIIVEGDFYYEVGDNFSFVRLDNASLTRLQQ